MNAKLSATKFSTSPAPKQESPAIMDFPTALRAVMEGSRITKLEWANDEIYGLLRDRFLMLHKPDGFHTWIINDGDLLGKDWVVVPPTVH